MLASPVHEHTPEYQRGFGNDVESSSNTRQVPDLALSPAWRQGLQQITVEQRGFLNESYNQGNHTVTVFKYAAKSHLKISQVNKKLQHVRRPISSRVCVCATRVYKILTYI